MFLRCVNKNSSTYLLTFICLKKLELKALTFLTL